MSSTIFLFLEMYLHLGVAVSAMIPREESRISGRCHHDHQHGNHDEDATEGGHD